MIICLNIRRIDELKERERERERELVGERERGS